jgi:lipopolysaccharide export system permease protein
VRTFDVALIIGAVLLAAIVTWRLILMLGILDRQRYWAFFKAYLICYISLVGLYIVIDAFSNLDEFTKRADGTAETLRIMARFYLVHQSEFFDRLCGVIGMMAAIFTVTWMQRNNEHLAMLAAGISTHRAIVPVLVSSVIVSLIAVGNQEVVMPYFGEELSRRHDDDGTQRVNLVATRYDARNIMLLGRSADRASRTITKFDVTIPPSVLGKFCVIDGKQASYIPPDHPTAPMKGGWLIREARVDPPLDDETLRNGGGILTRLDGDEGFPPPLPPDDRPDKLNGPDGDQPDNAVAGAIAPHSEIAYLASMAVLPFPGDLGLWKMRVLLDRKLDFNRGTYFLKTSLTFQAMTRKSNWYQFATTPDLLQSLTDPTMEGTQGLDVAVFLHSRLLRPVLSMALLFMSLPLVLGGYGRNMFINLGFALGNSALFYGTLIFTQYLGSFAILSPPLTAWVPLMGFGMLATVRWGQIRT